MTERYDHLFPRFHVRPPTGFVNDPNGPLAIDGELHLYFQYRAAASGAGPVSWGHATSSDFVTWRYHRPAIAPQPYGPDRDGCWSGTTVCVDGRVAALYAGFAEGVAHQPTVLAWSTDYGFGFGDGRVVVPGPDPGDDIAHYRDPFVWREDERWRMLVGTGDRDHVAAARLYESSDLIDWSDRGALLALVRQTADGLDTGAMWECPQLARLSGTDVLIVSPWVPGEKLKPVLTIADPTGAPVIARLDHGSSFYAASVLRESPFGPLVWGWATEERDDEWCVETDWSGLLTLPRQIDLGADGRVLSRPLPALTTLRRDPLVHLGGDAPTSAVHGVPAQFELALELTSPVEPVQLRIAFSEHERLDCVVDPARGEITVDASSASADPRARGSHVRFADRGLTAGEPCSLTLFVDGSIVEAFTGSGACATVRLYPTTAPPWSIEVNGLAGADRLTVWEMGPAAA